MTHAQKVALTCLVAPLTFGLWACAQPPVNTAPTVLDRCAQDVEALGQADAALKARFDAARTLLKGQTGADEVESLAKGFERLSGTYRGMSEGLCKDIKAFRVSESGYARHSYCHDQRLLAIAAAGQVLGQVSTDTDARHLVWLLGAKRDWFEQSAACHDTAKDLPEAFEGLDKQAEQAAAQGGVCTTTPKGYINGGALQLDTGGRARNCRDLTLETALLCERKQPDGQFAPVEQCNGASLREGDRFKISFKATPSAHIYFFLYNSAGQFQMFFPGPEGPNLADSGEPYLMPPDHSDPNFAWIFLDDVGGVLEQIQVVASSAPIKELEALRGARVDASTPGNKNFSVPAQRTRGLIEPVATRGTSLEPVATRGGVYKGGTFDLKSNGKGKPLPSSILATGKDIAAVEFIIRHEP